MDLLRFTLAAVLAAMLAMPAQAAFAAPPPGTKRPATPHAKLSLEDARQRALAAVHGSIRHEELEKEHGRWTYSFEILPEGGKKGHLKEVNIDANTDEIVAIEDERYSSSATQ
jgi:uncharacterized membrane protein YkoI